MSEDQEPTQPEIQTVTRREGFEIIARTLARRCEQSATAREQFRDLFPLLRQLVPGFEPYQAAAERVTTPDSL